MHGRGYIQIVGAPCERCERRVVSLDDGAACEHCGAVVHVDDACWQAHWEAAHVGASDYRGATKAPAPFRDRVPVHVGEALRPPAGTEALLCTACRRRVFAPATTSFFGFKQFTCPDCVTMVHHPLSGARQTVYIVMILVSGAVVVLTLSQGSVAWLAFLFVVLSVVALVQNRGIKQQLERTELAEPTYVDAPLAKNKSKKKSTRNRAKPAELP